MSSAAPPMATPDVPFVLVVDDDEELRDCIAELLRSEGLTVRAADNGLEALELLHQAARPRVIVLDLMMPVMSGAEFRAEQMKDDELASIPVILLTAAHDGRRQAQRLGISSYFTKPIPIEPFLTAIRTYL